MGSVCLLLLLGAVCTTARSAVLLRQDAQDKTVREGEEATFRCSLEGADMSDYWMYWYRKGEQGALTWIYRDGGHYGTGFQGRFVGEAASSGNGVTLRLRRAARADRAVYLCAAGPRCQRRAAEPSKNREGEAPL